MLKNKWIFLAIFCVLFFYSFSNITIAFAEDNSVTTERLSGKNRYETSIAISKAGWKEASTVIIASGLNYADALAGSSLSKLNDAPILLTAKTSLESITIDELKRLKTTKAFLIGGTGVIGTGIEKQLTDLGIVFTRIGGTDRYDTSKKVAEIVGVSNGIIMSSDSGFADSLSIATIASIKSIPILISPQNSLNPQIKTFIKEKTIPVSYIVGGKGVLGASIDSSLVNSKRLSGADRYATNLSINIEFANDFNFDTVYLASGNDFPDALGGSALAAKNNSPIFLTDKNSISVEDINFLKSKNVKNIVLLGGIGVVSEKVNDKLKQSIKVTIVHPELVSLNKTELSLIVEDTNKLIATIKPDNAVDKTLNWKSSNDSIATVDNTGKVTAVSSGSAVITVTTLDGSKQKNCNVTITNKVIPNKVTSITLNKSVIELSIDTTESITQLPTDTLIATILPDNTVNKEMVWTSNNNNIAIVDKTGKVTAISAGNAIITVTTLDGSKQKSCNVSVTNKVIIPNKVTDITLNKSAIELSVSGTDIIIGASIDTLIPTILPANALNKSIVWVSNDNSIVKVDNKGKVTAIKEGTAIITAITTDQSKTATCAVVVKLVPVAQIIAINFKKTEYNLMVGEKTSLTAIVTPNTANEAKVWTSSNKAVAVVDNMGNITATGEGTSIVIVTAADNFHIATCTIIVKGEYNKENANILFAIDIGHNAKYDTGAVGIRGEDACTKEIGTLVISKLKTLGYKVIDCSPTNATSTTNSLKQRTDIANAANADYYMSIHFNIFNGLAKGSEIFIGSNSIKDKAQEILSNLSKLGYVNRGIKDNSRGLYVLSNTDMPAMLVECSFLDSASDMAMYNPNDIADALVNGIITKN